MSYVDELIAQGYEGYRGWGENEARANFAATGGAGKEGSGGGTASSGGTQNESSAVIDAITKLWGENIAGFDKEGARASAEQEWNPYYDQLLGDYLNEVSIGRGREGEDLATYLSDVDISRKRAKEDLNKSLGIMGERREEYLGGINRESPLIQEAIGGRAADRGEYFSGSREEDQRRQLEDEVRQKATYESEYGYSTGKNITSEKRTQEEITRQEEARQLENKRYLEDVERKKKQRERLLAEQREQAITGQVVTSEGEYQRGY